MPQGLNGLQGGGNFGWLGKLMGLAGGAGNHAGRRSSYAQEC